MSEYLPSPWDFVAEHVKLYEGSGGTEGVFNEDTEALRNWCDEQENGPELRRLLDVARGLPTIIVTHRGRKTGAIRKTPLMTVLDGNNYILVASLGGVPYNPQWVYNLRADTNVEIRDATQVHSTRVRELVDPVERQRPWEIAVKAYPTFQLYQEKTDRVFPLFVTDLRSVET